MRTTQNRRTFLRRTAVAAFVGTVSRAASVSAAASDAKVRAIAFDAFPIFDPRPVSALAQELFPGKGAELSNAWRTRQFEYTWLRTVAGRYADFWQVTGDALKFAARSLKIDLDS